MQKRKMKLFVDFNKYHAGTIDVWNEEGTCLRFYAGQYLSTKVVVNGKMYKDGLKKFTQHIGATPTVVRKIINGFIQGTFREILPKSALWYTRSEVQRPWMKTLKVHSVIGEHKFFKSRKEST